MYRYAVSISNNITITGLLFDFKTLTGTVMLNLGIIKKVIIIFWKKQKSVSFIFKNFPFLLSKINCFIAILHIKVKNNDQYVTEWEPLINRHMYIIFKVRTQIVTSKKNPFKTKLRLRIKQKISHLNSTIYKKKKKKKENLPQDGYSMNLDPCEPNRFQYCLPFFFLEDWSLH